MYTWSTDEEHECCNCGCSFTESDDPYSEHCSSCYAMVCEYCGSVPDDPATHVYTVSECERCGDAISPETTCAGELVTICCAKCT